MNEKFVEVHSDLRAIHYKNWLISFFRQKRDYEATKVRDAVNGGGKQEKKEKIDKTEQKTER